MYDVAVTGASGFIGRAVVAALRQSGRSVAAVARRSGPDLVTVRDYRETPAAPVVVHLAETGDRAAANRGGDDTVTAAVDRVSALLSGGMAARIVLASSVAVYGERADPPFTAADPTPANDPYARAKLESERVVRDADGIVLRLSNVYGPCMPKGAVLSDILAQIPGEGPLEVRDASPARDFLWIDDAAAAFVAAVDRADAGGGTWNVAYGRSVTIGELAQLALDAAGQGDRPVRSCQPGLGGRQHIDIDDTTAALGWRPTMPLETGLERLVGAGEGTASQ